MALSLTSRAGARVEIAGGARVSIEAEGQWFATGTAADLATLADRAGRCATRVRDDLLLLDFGNVVGLYPLVDGTLEVRSRKWTTEDFDATLEDLFRVVADLPFLATESASMPVATDADLPNDVLYRSFLYLRHAMHAEHPRSIAAALRAIARDPHRRFERHDVATPLSKLRDVRFDRLPVDLTRARRWTAGARGLEGLGIDAAGAVPAELPEPRVRDTFDTVENRFARGFVDHALIVVDATCRAVAGKGCGARVYNAASTMKPVLEAARSTAPLRDVGRLAQLSLGSAALQRRRGYRELLHHFVRMRHAAKGLPFSSVAFETLLEGRDVARLYELWAFFQVVESVTAVLGPAAPVRPKRTDLGVVSTGFEVTWPADVRVRYQQSFTPAGGGSYSVEYAPDVTLLVGDALHLFDAKFRLDPKAGAGEPSFQRDDIAKMHAYRDAIRGARSAWILYPGARSAFFDADEGPRPGAPGPEAGGVGAVSLRPGAGRRGDLDRVVRGLLGAPPSAWGAIQGAEA